MAQSQRVPVLAMAGITKQFPGVLANDRVDFTLEQGEIHALLGENGAGKSTLMKILYGLYAADSGTISVRGQEVLIREPNDALRLGIGMVHQHFKLVEDFTVLENITLGAETVKNGFLKMDEARKKVMALSNRYKLYIDPDAKVSSITVGMQQRVEILKMLYRDNEILIFDEPTAVLTPQEIDELMNIMKELSKEGKSLIFITHKLEEIKKVADKHAIDQLGNVTTPEKLGSYIYKFIIHSNELHPNNIQLMSGYGIISIRLPSAAADDTLSDNDKALLVNTIKTRLTGK